APSRFIDGGRAGAIRGRGPDPRIGNREQWARFRSGVSATILVIGRQGTEEGTGMSPVPFCSLFPDPFSLLGLLVQDLLVLLDLGAAPTGPYRALLEGLHIVRRLFAGAVGGDGAELRHLLAGLLGALDPVGDVLVVLSVKHHGGDALELALVQELL